MGAVRRDGQEGKPRGFLGTAVYAPEPDRVEILNDHLITVDADGHIDSVLPAASEAGAAAIGSFNADGRLTRLSAGELLLPGLVDLHIHAPQWPQLGSGLDRPLENWLQELTFPLESRFAEVAFARAVYDGMVATLLANGTTTGVYFASLHPAATVALAEICLSRGQRAVIGRTAMDHPEQCPAYYRDSSAQAGEELTRSVIEQIRALSGNENALVLPAVIPRFIPSCTDDLLTRLGRLAGEAGCHIQTHCSESDWQHNYVFERCGVSDTAALDRFGLLTRRTVLAHSVHVGGADRRLIADRGAGIAHCPLSNAYFANAVMPLRQFLDEGLHIGLGTDIAGGPSPSILDNARHAIAASRLLESGVDPDKPEATRGRHGARIGGVEAFHLATAGGGKVLDLPIGLFRPGFAFDALIVRPSWNAQNTAAVDLVPRLVQTLRQEGIGEVWVRGRLVHRSTTVHNGRDAGPHAH